MSSKIRIKMGSIEVEYEGSEEFLREELKELLAAVVELYQLKGSDEPQKEELTPGGNGGTTVIAKQTTANIAAKLSANSGTDLALAAAAHLMLVAGGSSFTRSELLVQMKTATTFYKASYSSNLTNIIASLVGSGKFREIATNTYALSSAEVKTLEVRLAE